MRGDFLFLQSHVVAELKKYPLLEMMGYLPSGVGNKSRPIAYFLSFDLVKRILI